MNIQALVYAKELDHIGDLFINASKGINIEKNKETSKIKLQENLNELSYTNEEYRKITKLMEKISVPLNISNLHAQLIHIMHSMTSGLMIMIKSIDIHNQLIDYVKMSKGNEIRLDALSKIQNTIQQITIELLKN
ncbi:hypothetical protein WKH57_00820 [Niallia taxi]|uniref:hypothetical protein n=1 Tax=Niallia taxi TaxID=2499688 RepID=UPI00317814E6